MANSSLELDSFLSRSFLDLEKIDENLYRSKSLWKHKRARNAYGGQVIGQSLVAASSGIPDSLYVHSFHSYFLRGGNTDIPMLYHVDKTRDGRTYCARTIKAVQAGNTVLTMQASFKKKEPLATTHQLPMPKVPHPDDLKDPLETLDHMREQQLLSEKGHKMGVEWYDSFPIVTKFVNPDHFLLNKPMYPKRQLWMKAKGHIGDGLHENTHKCCLAYMSDMYILHTSTFPFVPFKKGTSMFLTSLDHSMWFHAPCQADEWMLYEIEADYSGDGRSLCQGRIWDLSGTLVTTIVQEGIMRISESSARL